MSKIRYHTHLDERGFMVKCYHKTTNVLKDVSFWIGVTISFPIEHYIWERVPGFSHITKFLGL